MKAPCKDCTERAAGCHSHCEKYIAYDKEQQEMRKKRALLTIIRGNGPNKKARLRKNTLDRMRGRGK